MLGGVTAAEAKSSKSAKYDLVIVGAGCGGWSVPFMQQNLA